jgi:hypothetical protein
MTQGNKKYIGMKKIFIAIITIVTLANGSVYSQAARNVWSKEQANEWYAKQGWVRGCNFIPSTAINQLEMWQKETFDPITIDRELGYAEGIGLNATRVFLHHVAWQVDPSGFKSRMKQYLTIADKHHIKTLFVFFDDCWDENYAAG